MYDTLDDVIREARRLQFEASDLYEREEAGEQTGREWEALEDARADFINDLAALELIDW